MAIREQKIISGVLLGIIFICGAFLLTGDQISQSGSESSRLAVVQSLVDNGTFDISGSIFKTVDKAELNGKLYGDKPPLLTLLTAGYCRLLKVWCGLSFEKNYFAMLFAINMLYFLTAGAVGVFFYAALSQKLPRADWKFRMVGAVAAVAATPVLSYAVTINNHTPCALLLIVIIWYLQRPWTAMGEFRRFLTAGLLCGVLLNIEWVTGGSAGLAILWYCLRTTSPERRLPAVAGYLLGGGIMAALIGVMNFIAYGSIMPLYFLTHKPDMGGKDYLGYAFNVLFGFEGFFLYVPAVLFIFYALFKGFRRTDPLRTAMLGAMGLSALIFVVATSDYGGWCYGFRFLIPAAPVALYYIFVFWRTWRSGAAFAAFCVLLVWGFVFALTGTSNPWNASYEGSLTVKGSICNQVRNSFLANLLAFGYEYAPDNRLTLFLLQDVYGEKVAYPYLVTEYWNRQNRNMLKKVHKKYTEMLAKEGKTPRLTPDF